MLDYVESSTEEFKSISKVHAQIAALLAHADVGVITSPDEAKQACDMQVHNPALFGRIIGRGSLGLGEAYMDGWWDCQQLDEFFYRVISAELAKRIQTWSERWALLKSYLCNLQIRERLQNTAAKHYDTGNDLYERMLDPRMIYSCAYWRDASTLELAQEHKLELVARKLMLQPGMRVLDIGCGWGGAADYLANNHGVEVVGITLSEQQYVHAQTHFASPNVQFQLQDYRNFNQRFDRVYSLGMFEHVGFKNYSNYFDMVDRCLNSSGLFLLHTIGHRVTSHRVDPWMNRYIFPNSILPSAELITRYSAPTFELQDWHNFGLDYHTTLLAWDHNCRQSWENLPNYDERFRRMWHYFLMCSAGAFKAGHNQLWQVVFSKGQLTRPYETVRSAV